MDANIHPVMGELKKEIKKRLDNLVELDLNEQSLMKAISCHLIPVLGYVMHVFNLEKGQLDKLDMIVKSVLRREGFNWRQLTNGRLSSKSFSGGRELIIFKEVYDDTLTRVTWQTN